MISERKKVLGYAKFSDTTIIESQPLHLGTSSQKAEIIALIRALILTANKRANTYTDSKYIFHIIHSHAAIWKERGLLSTKGSPITNDLLILQLWKIANMPSKVGIIHCWDYQVVSDPISRGNHATEREAKQASLQSSAQQCITIPNIKSFYLPKIKTRLLQEEAQPQGDYLQKQGLYVLPQS